jgi:uncharacterized membrane-anchored protein YitT (DUF2179 family)
MVAAKKVWTYFVVALIAFVAAWNYELFVFPNSFAPSGINGICTMIQHVFGISVGYLSLLVNIPLAIWCYIEVSKPVALRSMVYVGVFSVALLILDHVDLSAFAYSTENGTSKILGPLVAGIIMGYCYNLLMRSSAYSGGTDFISAIIHKRNPNKSVMGITFILNAIVAVGSYFVYDFQMEPVILCIIYSFASTTVGERLTKSGREAIRFEIVTDHPGEISKEIIAKTKHTTTVFPAKGMYSGRETNVLICIVNKTQASTVSRIIRKYPRTFAVMSQVNAVMGNFKELNTDGSRVVHMLDKGDGKTM